METDLSHWLGKKPSAETRLHRQVHRGVVYVDDAPLDASSERGEQIDRTHDVMVCMQDVEPTQFHRPAKGPQEASCVGKRVWRVDDLGTQLARPRVSPARLAERRIEGPVVFREGFPCLAQDPKQP